MTLSAYDRFGFSFVTLAHHWRREIERELSKLGFTDATWRPLIHLSEGGDGITQSELALRLGLDGSSLVRLIDLLEARGLIERRVDVMDRRARLIDLTEAGRVEVAKIRARILPVERNLLKGLPEAEVQSMLAAFEGIAARLREGGETE